MRPRTEFLLRQSSGRRRLPEVLAHLTDTLHRPLGESAVQPLEIGDRLRECVLTFVTQSRLAGRPPALSAWSENAASSLENGLLNLGKALAPRELFYLPLGWDDVGPILLDAKRDLRYAVIAARGWPEEFLVTEGDGSAGLRLEYHARAAEHGELFPYELTIWGAEWQVLAARAVAFNLSRS